MTLPDARSNPDQIAYGRLAIPRASAAILNHASPNRIPCGLRTRNDIIAVGGVAGL